MIPVLARVVRGGVVESEHRGHLVVTGPDGAVVTAVGDVTSPVFPRSSLKPVQAWAMLRAGWRPADARALALACASHSGEEAHRDVVASMLEAAGLGLADLDNTPDWPLNADAAARWREEGHGPEPVTQNCSGKHAAMVATCVAAGWPTAGYRDPGHPLQVAIRALVEEVTGESAAPVSVDGCGAPLFSTSLAALARVFGRIAAAPAREPGGAAAAVAAAMTAHPDLVGGTGRDATLFMRAVPGLVAKDGAEGVFGVGLPDGTGLALKIADGAARPVRAVVAAALAPRVGDRAEAVRGVGHTPVLGHGELVGAVVAADWAGAWAGAVS